MLKRWRERAEAAVRRDGAREFASVVGTDYNAVLDAIGEAGIVTTPEGVVLAWNRAAETLYGWTAEDVLGRLIQQVTVAPWDAEQAQAIMEQLRRGETWSGEFPVWRKDHSEFVAHVTDSPVLDDSGSLVAIVGISRDVTERRMREETLLRAQERQELVFDAARMGSWAIDRASRRIEWDPAMEALFGLEPGTFDGTRHAFAALVHPEDRPALTDAFPDDRDWAAEFRFEHRVIWPDGTIHWVEQRGRGVLNTAGEAIGMVGVALNIDDRKQIDAIAREAESLRATADLADQLEEAERLAKIGSWYWNAEKNIVTLSREMAALLGTDERLSGQQFRAALEAIAHSDDAHILYDAPVRAIESGRPFVLEQRLVSGDGERIVLHRGEVDFHTDGTVAGLRGTTQDITEDRRAEQELLATTRRLAEERRAVIVLREALVRPEFPALPGYDLAASYLAAEHHPEIGGDWYDAFLVPDGRLMLTIGDISGHGIVAARFMAKLRHAARAYACIDPDPQVVMAKLNEFVHHYMADDFATAQLALITPETGDVKLVSAGHPPPLHRRPAHASFVPVRNSPPAGILRRDSTPPSATMHLDSGEALIFYTDGLVERRDEILDAGLQRLADAARRGAPDSAASLAQRVVHGCLSGTDQSDDACVLVVLRQAPSAHQPTQRI